MTLDWDPHFDALYDALGTSAVLTAKDSVQSACVTVIDKVRGVVLADDTMIEVQGSRAACVVRVTELRDNNFCLDELDGGSVAFNGRCWRVEAHHHNGPDGKCTGEVTLLLTEET